MADPSKADPSNPVTRDDSGVAHMPAALIGVYADDRAVRRVRDDLGAAGVDPARIRVGDDDDRAVSLQAEQQQETDDSWSIHSVPTYPKEATKGGLAIGIPIMLGFTFLCLLAGLVPWGSLGIGQRLLITGFVGIILGGAIGMVAGPALAARRPNALNAAHRGIVVRVDDASDDVQRVMAGAEPIRLDLVHGAAPLPLGTVTTEDQRDSDGIYEEAKRNTSHPPREDEGADLHPLEAQPRADELHHRAS